MTNGGNMFGPLAVLGDVEVGKTLIARTSSVVPNYKDLEQGSEGFQWLRDGEPIKGETLRTYTISENDEGSAISLAYTFRAYGEDQQVISDPKFVLDPVSEALAAIYFLLFDREPDEAGKKFYTNLYKAGANLSFLVKDMERNKSQGAR